MKANSFELSASQQDYLEAVFVLSRDTGFARARDISRFLKVSMPSVSAAIRNLDARGLLCYERYGYIRLTPKGVKDGARIAGHHSFLKEFLMTVLGLDEAEAERDACRAEHALGPATLVKLRALSGFLRDGTRRSLLSSIRAHLGGKRRPDGIS